MLFADIFSFVDAAETTDLSATLSTARLKTWKGVVLRNSRRRKIIYLRLWN